MELLLKSEIGEIKDTQVKRKKILFPSFFVQAHLFSQKIKCMISFLTFFKRGWYQGFKNACSRFYMFPEIICSLT
jgi:hypothetical protein